MLGDRRLPLAVKSDQSGIKPELQEQSLKSSTAVLTRRVR
jgi:hypothetical protein